MGLVCSSAIAHPVEVSSLHLPNDEKGPHLGNFNVFFLFLLN